MPRYEVHGWHGEGDSVFYVADTEAPEAEQPAIVMSTFDPISAAYEAHALNTKAG